MMIDDMIVLFLTSLDCPEVLTPNCSKQTQKKNGRKRDAFPIILSHFTFAWNNDTPPYAHCVRFGGEKILAKTHPNFSLFSRKKTVVTFFIRTK